jgi:DNA processing protein
LQPPGHHLLTISDPGYPELLTQLQDPPALLFIRGDPELLSSPQLAMVGSRNPTPSGRQTARDFARFLASAGITITSGLAIGIDGASHEGALQAEGHTIAVMATGPDRLYPARHRRLAEQIQEQGALVTEFPPGTPPKRGHFPRRNRLISGLSLGTLVVEAAQRSGSLITARLAAEQGREVFAIPGSIHNPLARGCHALIRQGAKLVETAQDVVEELGPLLCHLRLPVDPRQEGLGPIAETWDQDYQRLLDCLGFDPVAIDLLIQRSGLTADAVSSMLLLLELEGYVSSAPGGRYCLTGKSRPDPSGQESVP